MYRQTWPCVLRKRGYLPSMYYNTTENDANDITLLYFLMSQAKFGLLMINSLDWSFTVRFNKEFERYATYKYLEKIPN